MTRAVAFPIRLMHKGEKVPDLQKALKFLGSEIAASARRCTRRSPRSKKTPEPENHKTGR